MPEVHWSPKVKAKLEILDPAVRDQLTSNAGEILHDVPPVRFSHDEGFEGEIMWHRGTACGSLPQDLLAEEDDDGPWRYLLFYTAWRPGPEDSGSQYFEVLDICGIGDVAEQWERMEGETP